MSSTECSRSPPGQLTSEPTELWRDRKPVLVVPEPNAVLYRLLPLAYPPDSVHQCAVSVERLDGIASVYEAARKYQFVRVERLIVEMLHNSVVLDAHPHRLFANLRLCDLPDLARKAALCTLKLPIIPGPAPFPESQLTLDDGQRLVDFHKSCRKKALQAVELGANSTEFRLPTGPVPFNFVWWLTGHCAECKVERASPIRRGPLGHVLATAPAKWFQDHIARIKALVHATPASDSVQTEVISLAAANNRRLSSLFHRRE
ncbi:hypothetical protein B0H11DRAFT_2263150 [Mycena galericulata]|nr:hypothetical protein B0H11DRAFT_2263150 [Mycena galericulata]